MIASLGGGFFSTILITVVGHYLKGRGDYSAFVSLRDALAILMTPLVGMQTAFAQLAAKDLGNESSGQWSSALKGLLKGLLLFWVVLAVVVAFVQRPLATLYNLPTPALLWFGLAAGFFLIGTPALFGVLQGKQDFWGLGFAKICTDVGLCIGVCLGVVVIRPDAFGASLGLSLGAALGFIASFALTRKHSTTSDTQFDTIAFIKRFLPLSLGLGVTTYMFGQDMLTVQRHWLEGTDGYAAARVVGRTVVFLTAPLTWVMFPKVAQNVGKAESTTVLAQALGATALIGGGASLLCTLFPSLPLRILNPNMGPEVARLVPWFAWGLLPLALSIVLINNLLARERFELIPAILAVAVAYGITLHYYHPSFESIIGCMIGFGLLLLGVSWIYTRRALKPSLSSSPSS